MAITKPPLAPLLPNAWQEGTEQLLGALETVGTSLLHLLSSVTDGLPSEAALLNLLSERGQLVDSLARHINEGGTATYVEWNRMVIIHHQGLQIDVNLRALRQRLTAQASMQERHRAYLDCVTGVCNEDQSSRSSGLLA